MSFAKTLMILISSCLLFSEVTSQEEVLPGQKLFLVGGFPPSSFSKTEIIDLLNDEDNDNNCPATPDYPGSERGSVGTYINNNNNSYVLVCGGHDENGSQYFSTNSCYTYDPDSEEWQPSPYSMTTPRSDATAVLLSDGRWWVTGGTNWEGSLGSTLYSTEIFTEGEGFERFVSLPWSMDDHSLVRINDTHFVVTGDYQPTDQSFMFDMTTEEWTELPAMPFPTRYSAAGLVTLEDGITKEVVIVAGTDTNATQILSLDTLTWRLGPDFPAGTLERASSVPYGDTFLVVGGLASLESGEYYLDTMFVFDAEGDDGNGEWVKLGQTMSEGKNDVAAFLVPDDFVDCSA